MHMFALLLITYMFWDHFIDEPRRKDEKRQELARRRKKAEDDFNKLYEIGASGCPVLKSGKVNIDEARIIVARCPAASRFLDRALTEK